MSDVPDVLTSIAVAKYRKVARSTSELREAFKKAVLANDPLLTVLVEQEHLVRAGLDKKAWSEVRPENRKLMKKRFGFEPPKTYLEAVSSIVGDRVYEVEMLLSHAQFAYELEAKCTPLLVEKFRKGLVGDDKPIRASDANLAFSKSASFLDAVFIGGMGCERMMSPRPMRSSALSGKVPKQEQPVPKKPVQKQTVPKLPTVVVLVLLISISVSISPA